jgi:uncharacterized protein (DUF58 family)
VAATELVFPLIPRTRLQGLPFGGLPSWRRGLGSDIAGSRPYRPGDDIDDIDWASSARLSAARGSDEFVVREHYAEEAPRVVVIADRRPAMALYPEGLPFLRKAETLRCATTLVANSTAAARGLLGYVDFGDGDPNDPFWLAPRTDADLWLLEAHDLSERFDAPEDTVELGFEWLVRLRRALPPGSFVFVLSDFVAGPPPEAWLVAVEHGWDVVPVVIQDPVWEQSFPDVPGLVLPVSDAATGAFLPARLSRREVAERRERNEQRLAGLLDELVGLGLEPVVLGTSEPAEIHRRFSEWAEERMYEGGHA